MVKLEVVRAKNATLVKTQPLVAVFIGGTSGIAEYTARTLAATHADTGKGLRLYIVGRNAGSAEKIIADCTRECPKGQFRYVQATDLALLEDVDRVSAEIIRLEKEELAGRENLKIDLLFMSQALLLFGPRKETKEGLDTSMSLLYYSRARFFMKFLPLLLASSLPAHVVSIYAAGKEDKLFLNDLSLRDPNHYSFANARSHVVYMKTCFMETMVERYPGQLSFVHLFPGLVITQAFGNPTLPTWFKAIWTVAAPFARLMATAPSEAGERVLSLASARYPAQEGKKITAKGEDAARSDDNTEIALGTNGRRGGGAYAVGIDGETLSIQKAYSKYKEEDLAATFWDHTMKVFDTIESGNVFTG